MPNPRAKSKIMEFVVPLRKMKLGDRSIKDAQVVKDMCRLEFSGDESDLPELYDILLGSPGKLMTRLDFDCAAMILLPKEFFKTDGHEVMARITIEPVVEKRKKPPKKPKEEKPPKEPKKEEKPPAKEAPKEKAEEK